IVTQMFFDNEKYFAFVNACRRAGITVPIIPGLKPIVSPSQMTVLPKTFHVDLPSDLVSELMKCNDSASTRQVGVEWCAMQARDLLSRGVESIHFYSLNAVDSVKEVAKIVY
ncbi:MAG: methylenetetrahydrofolate reductase, partial [Candidatus Limisoma sp.]